MENGLLFGATFILSVFSSFHPLAAAHPNFPAVFAFGDSTLDAGNNNKLPTLVRADHAPYGRSLPGQAPSGRFCDGRLIPDFLVSFLGIKDLLPAYATASNLSIDELATGVSFASAGSGLDDLTAKPSLVMTMDQELGHFSEYTETLREAIGEQKVQEIISNALFVIGIGSNDWMMNYDLSPTRRLTYSTTAYADFLIGKLRSFVEELYNKGARKFAISGLGPLGCVPLQITQAAMAPIYHTVERRCIDRQNNEVLAYNSMLQTAIKDMTSSLAEAQFAYVDSYNPMMDMIKNPQKYGFDVTTLGCCGSGTVELGPLCNALTPVCASPSQYMFWDSVHPSEAAYKALAEGFMKTVIPLFH